MRAGTPLVLFVALGLPAGAIGVAWPHMRASLDAPLAGLGLLLAAFTAAYFIASASSGPLGTRLGTPVLLVGGCGLAATGLLGLALARAWWIVPLVSLLYGGGSSLQEDRSRRGHEGIEAPIQRSTHCHGTGQGSQHVRRVRSDHPAARPALPQLAPAVVMSRIFDSS